MAMNPHLFIALSLAVVYSLLPVVWWAWLRRKRRAGPAKWRMRDGKQATLMPVDFLKPEPRKLKELEPGATAHIDFTQISVDLAGKTYVRLEATIVEEPGFTTVTVCEKDGGYTLFLPKERSDLMVFNPRQLFFTVEYAPVVEIVIDHVESESRLRR
jgi:hypothetical protein